MMEEPVSMPGSFVPEPDFRMAGSARSSSLFAPSKSPSITYSYSQSIYALSRSFADSTHSCRKRPRVDTKDEGIKYLGGRHCNGEDVSGVSHFNFEAPSPAPLVNTDYFLAGGLDKSTTAKELKEDQQEQEEWEQDHRPSRYTCPSARTSLVDGCYPWTPVSSGKDRSQSDQGFSQSPRPDGWSKMAWTLTGGLAGKVLTFCWNGAFRGFHAGGGRGYSMTAGRPDLTASGSWLDVKETEDVFNAKYKARDYSVSTPLPGGFPEENDVSITEKNYFSRSTQSWQSSETPTQCDHGGDRSRDHFSQKNNWVMVNASDATSSRETSPVRKRSRSSMASLHSHHHYQHQPVLTARNSRLRRVHSGAGRSSLPAAGASYASPRSSEASTWTPDHTDAQIEMKAIHRPSPKSADGRLRHSQRNHLRDSTSSSSHTPRHLSNRDSAVASLQTLDSPSTTHPSPEILKFEKRMRRTNQRQDESMRRMNEQMQSLMRQAQDALATKVEVWDGGNDTDLDFDRGHE